MFQLARLLTLMNVAELFPFFVYYLADQLQRSAMQLICINLPALLEALTRTPVERSQEGRGDVDIESSLSQGGEESDQRKGGIRFRQKLI